MSESVNIPEGFTLEKFLCLGKAYDSKEKNIQMKFYKLDEFGKGYDIGNSLNKDILFYDGKKVKNSFTAGAVYEMVYGGEKNNHKMHLGNAKYLYTYYDDAIALALRTNSQAEETKARLFKKMKTETNIKNALEVLRPLHLIHSETDYYGQRIIEVLVIDYLRRGIVK